MVLPLQMVERNGSATPSAPEISSQANFHGSGSFLPQSQMELQTHEARRQMNGEMARIMVMAQVSSCSLHLQKKERRRQFNYLST